MTSSARGFWGLLLLVLAISALGMYLIMYQPHIATILGGCLMLIAFGFIFYVNLPPLFHYLSERASNVLAIYPDTSGKGLHIFSSFRVSRIKVGLSPLRSIQYYFLNTETRKMYYKVLFSHDMEAAKGRSGYEGYSSFEEDVLGGQDYKDALEKYSIKAGWPLKLGEPSREGEDESFETKMGGYTYKVETKKEMVQDTLRACCYNEEGKLQWRKKI